MTDLIHRHPPRVSLDELRERFEQEEGVDIDDCPERFEQWRFELGVDTGAWFAEQDERTQR